MKKNIKKNSQNGDQENIDIDQELVKELKAYHRAHRRLVDKLMAFGDNPTVVLATLHAVHTVTMKHEHDMCAMFRTRKASNAE